jgi:hypothetical protein
VVFTGRPTTREVCYEQVIQIKLKQIAPVWPGTGFLDTFKEEIELFI